MVESLTMTRMRSRVEAILDGGGADGGVSGAWHVCARLDGRTVYARDERTPVRSASTSKLVVLLAALGAVDAGRMSLDQEVGLPEARAGGSGVLPVLPSVQSLPLRELLALMIGVSDNTATNAVIDLVGFPAIDEAAAAVGAEGTITARRMMDAEAVRAGRDNLASASGLVAVTEALLVPGAVLPAGLAATARELLGAQQFNERMPALLPGAFAVLHKTGELEGICHDAGAVVLPDGRLLLIAILGTGIAPSDPHTPGDTIARVSREIVAACGPTSDPADAGSR